MVAWLERWGDRCLRSAQPAIYQQLLFHVGGTDVLRRYSGTSAYWQYVQVILDSFFSAAERAEMCRELIGEPLFADDPSFRRFLLVANAEIRCRELAMLVEDIAVTRPSLRSLT